MKDSVKNLVHPPTPQKIINLIINLAIDDMARIVKTRHWGGKGWQPLGEKS